MSLLNLLNIPQKESPRRDPIAELRLHLVDIIEKHGLADSLHAIGLPPKPINSWRAREIATAVHRIENLIEDERSELVMAVEHHELRHLVSDFEEMQRSVIEEEEYLKAWIQSSDAHRFAERDRRPDWFWEIALAVNAAFKGLLGSQGQSGHICARTVPIAVPLHPEEGWSVVESRTVDAIAGTVRDGDVVVLTDKVIAAAQGRIGPREVILKPDPKTIPPNDLPALAIRRQRELGFVVRPIHLLLADEYGEDQATLGADDHNSICASVADAIIRRLGVTVDVLISDTDTGLDIRKPLIGTLTIGATPLGATAGLTLYEAMRCAVAAEFTRGHTRGIPIVVCVPADRRRHRPNIGTRRNYTGILDGSKEAGITHA